ncbi:putative competence-damage inducible protein [Wickerhamomyces ciferrii]|uniref:Competence-damage inducible protein n=1 Tax=Wickerhamomyces ciferrii (strain ATCC 14091 / BCRC 22168 / CBS 111 / JCM 3599 / NBRC 0793 / NRRL Y-1031 F-60-10) TaxID=1206466 RepID=K0KID9_WICCF|nr:putative competence-damage inducible protein [Wickerhamomyces ciferrii]CCH44980.1 putative competence-damage inducible protein [Wickerhamomyces ciferrii]
MSQIKTAAILIIGDEVLNGKIQDTNSRFFAKFLFEKGIQLQKILVIGDESQDIIESVRELSSKYDFIVTTGGIGSTHDDITYESIAKAFDLNLELHQETVDKMIKLRKSTSKQLEGDALKAQLRMATLPKGSNVENIYLNEELWVPIVGINKKLYIFPGVPQLFEKMVKGLVEQHLNSRIPEENKFIRFYVSTKLSESEIAPHLTQLQKKAQDDGFEDVKIGSYPHLGLQVNTISILARSKNKDYLRSIVDYSIKNLQGVEIDSKLEDEYSNNVDPLK